MKQSKSSTVRTGRRTVAAVLLAAALFSGCGGGGDEDEEGDESESVDEELGLESEDILVRQARAENVIRDCMKEAGFDYVPVDPVAEQTDLVGQSGLSEEDFVAQYGYGITTLYEERKQLASGPNKDIRDSLSASDQVAYDQTLYGNDVSATFAVAVDTGDFSGLGGCVKEATDEVFGGAEVVQSLQDKLAELDARIAADPRMAEAIAEWSACMKEAGFELAEPQQVDAVLLADLEEIVGSPGNENPDYDTAALAALQAEEVAMVTADVECEEEHITEVEDEVQVEYEAAFREENADLLSKVPPP